MRFYTTYGSTAFLASFLFLAASVSAQNLILNGDFETDTFTVWPGYTGGGNPEEITGWIGQGNRGINPVFEVQNPAAVIGWTRNEASTGNIGINPVLDGRAPFGDNGDNDGAFLLMQGQVSVYQDIAGLTVGQDYTLSVDYNARNCCGDIPAVMLEINGEFIADFPDPDDFVDELVDPVLEGAWWFTEIPFTAEAETQRIEFFSEPSAGGDATFLLDNIRVEPAGGGNNFTVNGDFEEDAAAFVTWPGYLGNPNAGGGSAPFRDNGNNETQVALLQVTSSIEQEITGLTVGEEYTVSLDYNARDCCGAFPAPSLLIDDDPVEGFPEDEVVLPVGGENEWYHYETTIVATNEFVTLKIQNESDVEGGDSTLIIDNVFFGKSVEAVVGDLDGNGVLDVADVDLIGNAIAKGIILNNNSEEYGNRILSRDDLDDLLSRAGKLNGDIDFNGDVGFSDFLVLAENYGAEGDTVKWSLGDLDVNLVIGFPDFLILAENFGKGVEAASSVPEPSAATLMLFGVMLVGRRSRKR